LHTENHVKPYKISLKFPVQDHYMSQLKTQLAQTLEKDEKRIYFAFLTHTTKEIVTDDGKITTNSIRKKRKHKNLFAVEIPEEDFNMDPNQKLEVDVQTTKRSTNYFGQITRKNFSFIRTLYFDKDSTAKEVYLKVFKFLRFLYDEFWPEQDRDNWQKLTDEEAFNKVFDSAEKKPFSVRIVTNTRGFQECFFCGDRRCDNCELAYDNNISLSKDILPKIKDNDFKLELEIYFENMPDFIELSRLNSCIDYNKNVKTGSPGKTGIESGMEETKKPESTGPSIYDCFSQFVVPEQLGEDNQWYCSICKEFQKATKKMEIYKAPPVLMIQLKRFKHTGSLLSKSKIGDKIEFPLQDLDLSDYVLNHELPMDYDLPSFEEPTTTATTADVTQATDVTQTADATSTNQPMEIEASKEETKMQIEHAAQSDSSDAMKLESKANSPKKGTHQGKLLYDLFAVSNHYGSLGFGHYTAYCKNSRTGKWYSFDDSSVSAEDPDNVCSTASYVLFYRRKDFQLNV